MRLPVKLDTSDLYGSHGSSARVLLVGNYSGIVLSKPWPCRGDTQSDSPASSVLLGGRWVGTNAHVHFCINLHIYIYTNRNSPTNIYLRSPCIYVAQPGEKKFTHECVHAYMYVSNECIYVGRWV